MSNISLVLQMYIIELSSVALLTSIGDKESQRRETKYTHSNTVSNEMVYSENII